MCPDQIAEVKGKLLVRGGWVLTSALAGVLCEGGKEAFGCPAGGGERVQG